MVLFYSLLYERGIRSINQDSVALHRIMTRSGEVIMALICDGMGGEDRGELASGYLTECLSVWFYDKLPAVLYRGFDRRRIQRCLQRELFTVHEKLRGYGVDNHLRCGTTMTMLLMMEKHYILFQSGDSMACSIGHDIRTLVPQQRNSKGVERCIGIGSFKAPYVFSGNLFGRKAFLLYSDGFGDRVSREDIWGALGGKRISRREDADRALKTLASTGLRRGCRDNMSALYLKCR